MDGNRFTISFHIPGTLSANLGIVFDAPCDCTLVELQAVTSNASNAQIKAGTVASDAAYLAYFDTGDSSAPARKRLLADFAGGQYPRLTAGTHAKLTVDYDGASGTAAADLTVLAVFLEG